MFACGSVNLMRMELIHTTPTPVGQGSLHTGIRFTEPSIGLTAVCIRFTESASDCLRQDNIDWRHESGLSMAYVIITLIGN